MQKKKIKRGKRETLEAREGMRKASGTMAAWYADDGGDAFNFYGIFGLKRQTCARYVHQPCAGFSLCGTFIRTVKSLRLAADRRKWQKKEKRKGKKKREERKRNPKKKTVSGRVVREPLHRPDLQSGTCSPIEKLAKKLADKRTPGKTPAKKEHNEP